MGFLRYNKLITSSLKEKYNKVDDREATAAKIRILSLKCRIKHLEEKATFSTRGIIITIFISLCIL